MTAGPPALRPGSLPLANRDFAETVRPFFEARVLDLASIHTTDLLAHPAGVDEPDLLLGLAFAVRAPGVGHVGVDLATIRQSLIVEEAAGRPELRERIEALQWPTDEVLWRDQVVACSLVAAANASNVLEGPARPFVAQNNLLMPHRYWDYQRRLSDWLARRAGTPAADIGEATTDPAPSGSLAGALRDLFPEAEPDDRQRLAAVSASLNALTIVSGGPGTGKTYAIKKLLAVLWQQWKTRLARSPRAALVAPTGKAVVRMRDAIASGLDELGLEPEAQAWIGSLIPATIHRTLGFQPGSPTRFRHDADRRLALDLLIVDEASMVDLPTMCKLLEAVPPDARVVLLGDRHQLASVGAGSVLADITSGVGDWGIRYSPGLVARIEQETESEIPPHFRDEAAPAIADSIVQFTKPYRARSESGVQQTAYAIADERIETAASWLTGEAADGEGPFEDVVWYDHDGGRLAEAALQEILDAYAGAESYLARLYHGPQDGEEPNEFLLDVLSRLDRVRVLTAHRQGALGVAGLNETIETALRNPGPGRTRPETDAPYWHGRPILLGENRYDLGLMNGDVGVLIREEDELTAIFAGSEPGTLARHAPAHLPRYETVFAMTVHKSQGSEFEHTLLVLPVSRSPILTRELIYTALTRARHRVTLCGSEQILREGLQRTVTRASSLGGLLWD